MRRGTLILCSLAASIASPVGAATTADRGLMTQFVRLQDAASAAQSAAACDADPETAEKALHDRYDRRLFEIVRWLQERFSDEDLKAAQEHVHGAGYSRTKPPCPPDAAAIKATEAEYGAALEAFEARIRETLGLK
jgi:hypothetical protein